MGTALGLRDGGTRLTRFVNNKTPAKYIRPELPENCLKKYKIPLFFKMVVMDQNLELLRYIMVGKRKPPTGPKIPVSPSS
jgi:hypothetical protein